MYTRSQEIILVLLILILVMVVSVETSQALKPALFRQTEAYFRIDLNKADWCELDLIPGVGPVLANRIVEYREKQGRIQRIEELQNIKGFSHRIIEKMKEYVAIRYR